MSNIEEYNIKQWVDQAENERNKEFRQATHTILSAIATEPDLKASMVLKGGILLAIRYQSHRYTKDIDLSTAKTLVDIDPKKIVQSLKDSLTQVVEVLDYNLTCAVQSYKLMPANVPNATFPSIKMTVGYAYKGTTKHKRLLSLKSPTTISIDYSLNELTPNVEALRLSNEEELFAYSLTDLIAEKIRSLLQQIERNRNRRQDIFDLYLIIGKFKNFDEVEMKKIHTCLMEKARSRNIEPDIDSFENGEIKQRAKADYHTLEDEVDGGLPDFDASYEKVRCFYRSLPWP
jgi:predicted nucleotidyltransferase component of viral defense system